MTTPNQDKATARPWKFGGSDSREIFQVESGRAICKIEFRFGRQDEGGQANAALIVRAINERAALLAVAEVPRCYESRACHIGDNINIPSMRATAFSETQCFKDKFKAAVDALAAVRSGKGTA